MAHTNADYDRNSTEIGAAPTRSALHTLLLWDRYILFDGDRNYNCFIGNGKQYRSENKATQEIIKMKAKVLLVIAGTLLATSAMAAPQTSAADTQNTYATEFFRNLQLNGN